jgi:CelD/BcsL family acetyltransferase involved in cellulose biosynthesis
MSAVTVRVCTTFDDSAIHPTVWSKLLAEGDSDLSSLTWFSQRQWWIDNERPDGLRLLLAERDGTPKLIAPMFVENGMAMNLCPINGLDLIGDSSDPEVLDAILRTACREVFGFVGLRLYYVPHTSRTGELLKRGAERRGLGCFLEDEQPSPIIDLRGKAEFALACTRKGTILRRENQLRREGALKVQHFRDADDVLPQLDAFFEQHLSRWSGTLTPSRFQEKAQRNSFRLRTAELARQGWLRFSRLDWNGRPIAFHRGTCYKGHYKYGRTAFAPDLAHRSPGTVLLRHLLLAAIEENAHTFDFGVGDEAYKFRYATDVVRLQTWGLYPRTSTAIK